MDQSLARLLVLKQELEAMRETRAKAKTELDEIEKQAVQYLLHAGVRYIDSSNCGQGPYWVLTKGKADGSFNRERYVEFFSILLQRIHASPNEHGVEKCVDCALEYLKQFEKKRIVLQKSTRPPMQRGVEDLKTWISN